ncbi:hypothetical protein EDB89DRAFT_1950092 [Lactarius sanguifluus]|nr:hypothetical protein EDB89DRAFT_1950092 [Lactarius sanguifluus]
MDTDASTASQMACRHSTTGCTSPCLVPPAASLIHRLSVLGASPSVPVPFEAVSKRRSPRPRRLFVSGMGVGISYCSVLLHLLSQSARRRSPHRPQSHYLFDDPGCSFATHLCPSYLTASFPFHLVSIRVSLFVSPMPPFPLPLTVPLFLPTCLG